MAELATSKVRKLVVEEKRLRGGHGGTGHRSHSPWLRLRVDVDNRGPEALKTGERGSHRPRKMWKSLRGHKI